VSSAVTAQLCSVARSVFQQLRGTTAKKSKQPAADGAAPKIGGRPSGRISGVVMRHLSSSASAATISFV
jgi:hypothetical protein